MTFQRSLLGDQMNSLHLFEVHRQKWSRALEASLGLTNRCFGFDFL